MLLFVIAMLGSAIFNGSFFKFEFGGINVLGLFILFGGCTYLLMHFLRVDGTEKYKVSQCSDKWLWSFVILGAAVAILSLLGAYERSDATEVLFNRSYIPRQGYYLFFLPLIILAGRHYGTPWVIAFLRRHYRVLFWSVYFLYILFNKTLAIDVPCSFCLTTLLLMGRKVDRIADVAMLLLILASPVDIGGEMTQVIVRILCALFYFAKDGGRYLRPIMAFSVCIAAMTLIAPYVSFDSVGFDANTAWRLNYWRDEIDQLVKTHGLGVGLGTSYATSSFIGSAVSGPFAASAGYTAAERMFVVGCHNSFVSIAFRLGFVGLFLLLGYLLECSNKVVSSKNSFAVFASIAAIYIVCFNVGFENPMYFFLFAFGFAALGAVCEEPPTGPREPWSPRRRGMFRDC